jgi:hypothetical protein
MTIGIEKYLNEKERKSLLVDMRNYFKIKTKIFKELTKGKPIANTGLKRLHREITKEISPNFWCS